MDDIWKIIKYILLSLYLPIYLSCIYQSSIYLSKYIFIIMHLYLYLYPCIYIMKFSGRSKDDPVQIAKTFTSCFWVSYFLIQLAVRKFVRLVHSFTHSLIQQIFIEGRGCTRPLLQLEQKWKAGELRGNSILYHANEMLNVTGVIKSSNEILH